jgi:hypothetical protein
MPPIDTELYEKVQKKIRKKYGKPSAYASGATVQEYKRLGGRYTGRKSQELNKAIEAVGSGIEEKMKQYNIKKYGNAEGNRSLGGALQSHDINDFVNASYQKNKDAPQQIGEFQLDKDLSTGKAKVYHDPNTGKTVVANRGTQGTMQDWANNLAYMMGMYDKTGRYQNAVDTQKKAVEKYGKVDTNVGHSQSGIITRKLNNLGLTDEVINVNPASLGEKLAKNETAIRSSFDPVSMFQSNAMKIKAKTWNPLAEHSADILKRIPNTLIGH